MGAHVLTVEVGEYTAERLAKVALSRQMKVSDLAAEALDLFIIMEDQPEHPHDWSAEDLAVIQEGIAQLDRGEGISQEEVEREIDELLRS